VSSYKPRCPWWTGEKKTTLRVVIFLYSSRFVTSMHLFPERAECWMGYIVLWILYLYLFVIHNLRDFFLKWWHRNFWYLNDFVPAGAFAMNCRYTKMVPVNQYP
jgi:hypothetical protein